MRAVKMDRPGVVVGVLLVVAAWPLAAWAAGPPLPADEEAAVKHAMEDGVRLLKKAQLPTGTWAADSHPAGYAALPALTLLECGVPKSDPVLKRAEAYLRASLPTMDDTYELALSILFLDRLGEPKDGPMIQGLALRLVAGQRPTGGWGYKCPNLPVAESHALLKILHQIAPKPPPADAPSAGPPADPPTALPPNVVVPLTLSGVTVLQDLAKVRLEDPKPDDKAPDQAYTLTDNSTTQFAIVALWAAQRHDVPIDRTLQLIANRFQTSQNADGSWGYHYAYGGGAGEGAPMDCCGLLGLAVGHGIARGKEPVNAVQDKKIIDGFAALNKFVGAPVGRTHDIPPANLYFLWSLERVGVLYDLPTIADKDWYRWGAEAIIANQSAEGAWADGGGYPGGTPVSNTCLALLFLARTNLVSDLTTALRLNPDDLTKAITAKVAAPAPPPEPAPVVKPPDPPAPTPPPPPPTPTVNDHPAQPDTPKPVASMPVATTPPPTPAKRTDDAGGGWGWVLLIGGIVVLLILAGGGAGLLIYLRNRKKEEKARTKGKRKKGDGKPAARPSAGASAVKKSPGKTGPRK